jgi:hypothetical protein
MNRKTGKRLFFGCITLTVLMMGIGTGCPPSPPAAVLVC